MIKSNLHTHTIYCDGENTPEEMLLAAIAKGFRSLGFSEHAPIPAPEMCGMRPSNIAEYIEDVKALKEKYKGKINIFLGIENDSLGTQLRDGFDYTIGSVHMIAEGGTFCCIDDTAEITRACIRDIFDGDATALVKRYYREVMRNVEENRPDIIGHFDIITKFQDRTPIFDTAGKRYRSIALEALDYVTEFGGIVEVNTGAIARGYRQTPYPDSFILKRLKERNVPITVSADAHSTAAIDCFFPETEELLIAHGFTHIMELTPRGFTETALR